MSGSRGGLSGGIVINETVVPQIEQVVPGATDAVVSEILQDGRADRFDDWDDAIGWAGAADVLSCGLETPDECEVCQ
jgi:hypothetical protein